MDLEARIAQGQLAQPQLEQALAVDPAHLLEDPVESLPPEIARHRPLAVRAEGHQRVDDHELARARLDREVGMSGVADVAVHVVAPVDPEGLEEARDGRGRGDGLRNGRVHEAARAEYHAAGAIQIQDRKSTRLNSSHLGISYAVFCLKKKT